jgi:acyl-CoA thioesterase-2
LVGPPEDAAPADLGMVPWETRLVGGVDLADRAAAPARLDWWMRAAPVPDEPALHQALLAHATDLTLIGTALRPFEGISQADSTVTLHTAVTSHTVWFHQPFRVDAWLQISQHSPVVAGGRSYGRGDVFAGGELVASFAQEAMVRRLAPAS